MLTSEAKQAVILATERQEVYTNKSEKNSFDLTYYIFDREFERSQKRSSFPSWPAETGR